MPMTTMDDGGGYLEAASGDSNFFTGGTNDNLQNYDPLVTGQAFIMWTRFPFWVQKEFPNCKSLLEKKRGYINCSNKECDYKEFVDKK